MRERRRRWPPPSLLLLSSSAACAFRAAAFGAAPLGDGYSPARSAAFGAQRATSGPCRVEVPPAVFISPGQPKATALRLPTAYSRSASAARLEAKNGGREEDNRDSVDDRSSKGNAQNQENRVGGGEEGGGKKPKKKTIGKNRPKDGSRSKAKYKKKGDSGEGKGKGGSSVLELIDPFKAGQKLRRAVDLTVGTALTTLGQPSKSAKKKSVYYLDDRLLEPGEGPALFAERNPLFYRLELGEDFVPEVLVVGATGEVGRIVVQRLLLDGRFRVRVLVRDLYSKTLNLLGTGVTYCQGDLDNLDSLEFAVTDVDKIVFCAGAPRPDEDDFRRKLDEYTKENLAKSDNGGEDGILHSGAEKIRDRQDDAVLKELTGGADEEEWQRIRSVLEVRSRLAEQIDFVGMKNLILAYQNVRHADYGTSQAAKRSLFKFQSRPGDVDLFAIEEEEETGRDPEVGLTGEGDVADAPKNSPASKRSSGQCTWTRNKFGHGVFTGRVPSGSAGPKGEASVASGRLRSRDDPEGGIDLSRGRFGGFVVRLCADGAAYEAFIRRGDYDLGGIEYVCEFDTGTKPMGGDKGSKSTNKFVTVRLSFSQFQPRRREGSLASPSDFAKKIFDGSDVRQIGFRFRGVPGGRGRAPNSTPRRGRWSNFYLALSYIKVYRSQQDPEFVYVSDARIPPVVLNGMVSHNARHISPLPKGSISGNIEGGGSVIGTTIFDEEESRKASEGDSKVERSSEEIYYKWRGEEILRHSGLWCV